MDEYFCHSDERGWMDCFTPPWLDVDDCFCSVDERMWMNSYVDLCPFSDIGGVIIFKV